MASGDVVLQVADLTVQRDDSVSSGGGSYLQEVEFAGTPSAIPASGAGVGSMVIPVTRTVSGGGPMPETLFDSSKRYKLTIEEV